MSRRSISTGGSGFVQCAALAVAIALCAVGDPAGAQLSAAAGTPSGSSCSGDDADGFCGFSAGLTVNTSSTITSRHAWNINADIGIFSTRDVSGSAQHNVTFNATAVGGYRLDISTNRQGDIHRVSDAPGCDGNADTSGITGSSNFVLNSGTLTLADPGGLAVGGGDSEIPFNQSSSAVIYRISNGVAQAHTLTFTWNGSVRSNSCEVAVRQGEQNGTTTGCSACGYAGSPSRTQSTDGHFVTVSFTSLCGNGIIDGVAGEQCDQGAGNGTAGSCCTSQCQYKLIGTVCRAAAGDCDIQESCTGLSGACPIDIKKSAGTGCRLSAGQCDVEEVCNGVNNTCPANGFQPTTTLCRAGSAGEVCDQNEFCPGNGANCPADAVKPSSTLCRASAGFCDIVENCDGTNKFCPVDGFKVIGTTCRASAGVCDVAEVCTGMGPSCPANGFQSTGVVCRAAAGVCDLAETCSGSGATCPADSKSNALCRAASGVCDVAETCDGANNNCPADGVQPSGAPCRASAGICDVAESCDGVGKNCPANAFQPNSVECRASAGICDVAENCTGSGANCPGDSKSTALCRASAGVCDAAESCDGSGNNCPADAVSPSGTTCRAAAGACDVAEVCDGASIGCPADAYQPSGAPCLNGLFCDGAEICDGNNTCIDQPDPCPIVCAESLDACLASGCPTGPIPNCKTAAKSLLLIKNKEPDDSKDKLIWKWINGQSTSQADFADPESTANYALCIYTGTVAAQVDIAPSASFWDPLSNKGFKYFDLSASEDGVQKIVLKGSSNGKSKILLKGRGMYLPDPIDVVALGTPVKVQFINHGNGKCWESNFTSAKKNTTAQFKAKSP